MFNFRNLAGVRSTPTLVPNQNENLVTPPQLKGEANVWGVNKLIDFGQEVRRPHPPRNQTVGQSDAVPAPMGGNVPIQFPVEGGLIGLFSEIWAGSVPYYFRRLEGQERVVSLRWTPRLRGGGISN